MKLLRYGPRGQERSGVLDVVEQVRDLSGKVDDLAGNHVSQRSFQFGHQAPALA